jgi:serine/threonine protein kinase
MLSVTREKLAGICLECMRRFLREKEEETVPVGEGGGGATSPPDEILPLEIGSTFQGLQVLEFIARGGMGVVYKARQPDLNRIVALKVLSPKLAEDPEFAQRFNGEAKVLALLGHPNIVQVYDFGRASDLYYLVMEYVEGNSLRQILRKGRVGCDEVLRLLSQVCTALEYAHHQGIVHRDIKPENILVDTEGRVKIADFGLAKIMPRNGSTAAGTQTRVVMGTPQYMAPEQSGDPPGVDHRSDIYALGVILYEMLTGAPPHGHFPPPSQRAQVDKTMDFIVLKALEQEPDRRYQHASELKDDIDRVSTGSKGRALPGVRRRPALLLSLSFLALLFIGGLAWNLLWKAPPSKETSGARPGRIRSWEWENPGPGSRTEGEDLVFTPNPNGRLSEAVPLRSSLGKRFHLHFKYRYLLESGQEPWFFLMMAAAPDSGHERNALVIFPEAGHTIHFASKRIGKDWGMRDWQSLPGTAHGPEQWFDVDVYWTDETKRLKVRCGGTEVFNHQLGGRDTLDGVWSFGVGGTAKELRIRDVWVQDVP